MVKQITGDLLNVKSGIVCHQTNYHGVMGAGVAAAIKKELLTEEQYEKYVAYCYTHKGAALGSVQYIDTRIPGVTVANVFCQMAYMDKNHTLTSYTAMEECFKAIRDEAMRLDAPVYFPYKIGCGIAGGDWPTVEQIIKDVFDDSEVQVYIVKRSIDQ